MRLVSGYVPLLQAVLYTYLLDDLQKAFHDTN